MNAVLSVKGLSKQYPKFRLHDVSFEIQRGTIMGLIGRNGAGKTTTIKSILNLVHIVAAIATPIARRQHMRQIWFYLMSVGAVLKIVTMEIARIIL